ncbi:Rho GTPase activation protein [Rickenella mellea]|uniref:Rho GTPase activation protein n=1 Tax=Rickenella mellea TaxID=50990 RepID=A0A4Y7PNP0_9AGAM|nr:Rho GTPase activation protein [Rickenella mellea]
MSPQRPRGFSDPVRNPYHPNSPTTRGILRHPVSVSDNHRYPAMPAPTYTRQAYRQGTQPIPAAIQRLKEDDTYPQRVSTTSVRGDTGSSKVQSTKVRSPQYTEALTSEPRSTRPRSATSPSSRRGLSPPRAPLPPPVVQPQDPAILLGQLDDLLACFKTTFAPLEAAYLRNDPRHHRVIPFQKSKERINVKQVYHEHTLDYKVSLMRSKIEKANGCELGDTPQWRKPMRVLKDNDPRQRVFGCGLGQTRKYASCTTSLAGYQLDIPIIARKCIEQIYRTGTKAHHLLRAAPDRDRLSVLIEQFDAAPTFGSSVSLADEDTADVAALLQSYIERLPEPIFHPSLYEGFWQWCVLPTISRHQERSAELGLTEAHTGNAYNITDASTAFHAGNQDEEAQIAAARIIIRMLPATNFALFAYLFAFFTQLPRWKRDNHLDLDGIASIYGVQLFHSAAHPGGKVHAKVMMAWILKRWHRISKDIFDVDQPKPTSPPNASTTSPKAQSSQSSPSSSSSSSKSSKRRTTFSTPPHSDASSSPSSRHSRRGRSLSPLSREYDYSSPSPSPPSSASSGSVYSTTPPSINGPASSTSTLASPEINGEERVNEKVKRKHGSTESSHVEESEPPSLENITAWQRAVEDDISSLRKQLDALSAFKISTCGDDEE